jgi:hypothetical protein
MAYGAKDPRAALEELAGTQERGSLMVPQLLLLFDHAGLDAVKQAVSKYKAYRDLLTQHSILKERTTNAKQ